MRLTSRSDSRTIRRMSSQEFSLIVQVPDQEPTRHDLTGDSITIGRGPDNGIQVLVSEVSVKHGEFKAEGGGYRLVDVGSTNGTAVNGSQINSDGVELTPMDKVVLGKTINAYYVPKAVLESTPIAELIQSIDSASPAAAEKPATEPVAVKAATPGAAQPGPAQPKPAAPGAPTPVKPAVALPAQAAAEGATTVRLDQVKPGGGPVAPKLPTAPKPGGAPAAPAAPAAPGGGPPAPGGGPAAPKPVAPIPLKRPGAGGAPSPSIPLPKKPGEE